MSCSMVGLEGEFRRDLGKGGLKKTGKKGTAPGL